MNVKNCDDYKEGHTWWKELKEEIKKINDKLYKENPDIVGLQELKSDSSGFTENMFADLGYHGVFNGQKGYNGCGILSKHKIASPSFALPGTENDGQSLSLIHISEPTRRRGIS